MARRDRVGAALVAARDVQVLGGDGDAAGLALGIGERETRTVGHVASLGSGRPGHRCAYVDRQFGIACGLRLTASRDNDSYQGR